MNYTYTSFVARLEILTPVYPCSTLSSNPKVGYVDDLTSSLASRLGILHSQLNAFLFDFQDIKLCSEQEMQLLFPEDLLSVACHLKESDMMDPLLKVQVEDKYKRLQEYRTEDKTFNSLRVQIQTIRGVIKSGLNDCRPPLVERGNCL